MTLCSDLFLGLCEEFNQMSEIKNSKDPVQMSGKNPLMKSSAFGAVRGSLAKNVDLCYGGEEIS